MAWYRLIIANLFWWMLQIYWLWNDRLLRDGDEEGHVGAMELFKEDWASHSFFDGLLHCFSNIWMGDFGEYPPFFAACFGSIWFGLEWLFNNPISPYSPILRCFLLLPLWFSSICIARIGWRLKGNWELAWIAMLCLPLANGVGRHYMPENVVLFWTVLSIMMALEIQFASKWWKIPILGLVIGLGLLSKQTYVLIAPLVIVMILKGQLPQLFLVSLLSIGVAGPWYFLQMQEQGQYLWSSAQAKVELNYLWQLIFYPSAVILLGWGLVISLAVSLAIKKMTAQAMSLPLWFKIWMASLLFFILLPKQYPRLILAWLPIAPLLISIAFQKISAIEMTLWSLLFFMGMLIPSWSKYPQHFLHSNIQAQIDDGCPQVWLRPPSHNDFWMSDIAKLTQKYPQSPIAIVGDHEIDCTIQSTHSWKYHLDPYLRRLALDRNINFYEEEPLNWNSNTILIKWINDDMPLSEPLIVVPNHH